MDGPFVKECPVPIRQEAGSHTQSVSALWRTEKPLVHVGTRTSIGLSAFSSLVIGLPEQTRPPYFVAGTELLGVIYAGFEERYPLQ